jgi:hypothetical protein
VSDHDLRAAARDLEHEVPLPDFEQVAARGRRLRRRRRTLQVAASTSALCAAVAVGIGLARVPGRDPVQDPVAPRTERPATAAEVLDDPRAVLDEGATAVSDTGAVLQRFRIPTADPCGRGSSAWVWTPWEGEARTWTDRVGGRTVAALDGGFAVSAPGPDCSAGRRAREVGAYVVDAGGRRTPISWSGRAGQVCASGPAGPRCQVDVRTATGTLLPRPVLDRPSAATFAMASRGPVRWARSVDSRTVHWSADGGATWQHHRTSLPAADDVQVTAAGSWAVFFAYPEAEYTRDGGQTWHTWDGEAPLAPYLVANELVTVSADGDLVVVSHRPGKRPELLASTDDSWQRFRHVDVRTDFGTVAPQAAGSWLWVPDQARTWVSPDGLDWRAVPR